MNVYERYKEKVRAALEAGYSERVVIDELEREKSNIYRRCVLKQAELAMDRNIYKKREAARAARECIAAIERVCQELSPKETLA